MSVKKKKTKQTVAKKSVKKSDTTQSCPECCTGGMMCGRMGMCQYSANPGKRILVVLFGIFLVYLIVLFGTMIRNNLQEFYFIGHQERAERTIVVDAEAKVTAKPDIAMTSIGMVASGATVEEAQAENTRVMNSLIEKLKGLGVASDDIQTANYNIYPQYEYTQEEGRELAGYEVSQNVSVKIRDLDKANDVLALAGQVGANSVSGLEFIIDDKEIYRDQAREQALEKVNDKAHALATMLGVDLISVVSYDEYEYGDDVLQPHAAQEDFRVGGAGAPTIESGSLDVIMNVDVTFEIR